jgi:hypothetical protein
MALQRLGGEEGAQALAAQGPHEVADHEDARGAVGDGMVEGEEHPHRLGLEADRGLHQRPVLHVEGATDLEPGRELPGHRAGRKLPERDRPRAAHEDAPAGGIPPDADREQRMSRLNLAERPRDRRLADIAFDLRHQREGGQRLLAIGGEDILERAQGAEFLRAGIRNPESLGV